MMNEFLGVCLYLASMAEPIPSAHRVDTCQEVARYAMEYKLDPYIAVALAYHESRFDKKVISSHGAVGAMQVKRKFIDCQHCSDIEAGMIALRYWMDRSKSVCLALGRYAMGNRGVCGRRSRMIIALARELECRHGSDKDYCYEC